MGVFKRGKVYWADFYFREKRYQFSTLQTDKRKAQEAEAAAKLRLLKGEMGIRERQPAPTLSAFLDKEFLPFVESKCASKPATMRYYQFGVKTLKDSTFASLTLDQITDQHAGAYVAQRAKLSPSTVNCGLRTLRRALNLAERWARVDKAPRITLMSGERQRDRVLNDAEADAYLAVCEQPWKDVATLMLGTGCRPSEILSLRWEQIHLNGSGGWIQILLGKSRAAKRLLPMVPRVYSALKARHLEHGNPEKGWLFPAETESAHLQSDGLAKTQHAVALTKAKVNDKRLTKFCPYTLRHTALTNLAASGCDAFTLARIAGHSSITITQRYCHPQQEAIEAAFEKLQSKPALPESATR
jgi:integrase